MQYGVWVAIILSTETENVYCKRDFTYMAYVAVHISIEGIPNTATPQ